VRGRGEDGEVERSMIVLVENGAEWWGKRRSGDSNEEMGERSVEG